MKLARWCLIALLSVALLTGCRGGGPEQSLELEVISDVTEGVAWHVDFDRSADCILLRIKAVKPRLDCYGHSRDHSSEPINLSHGILGPKYSIYFAMGSVQRNAVSVVVTRTSGEPIRLPVFRVGSSDAGFFAVAYPNNGDSGIIRLVTAFDSAGREVGRVT